MPGSVPPEDGGPPDAAAIEAAVGRLESAVESLLDRYGEARARAARAEKEIAGLREELAERPGAGAEGEPESRLRELAEENRRLRVVVEEARRRAERIRSRLMVVEDEL